MRAAYFRHGHVETTEDLAVIRTVLADPDCLVWVDLPTEPSDEIRQLLANDLRIHPLVIEDLYAQYLLPKAEDFDDYLYVLLHCLRSEPGTRDLTVTELDLLLSERWLVTHALDAGTASCTVDKVFRESLRQRKLWERGMAWLFHAVVDHVVDEYLPVTEGYDEEIEELEAIVLDGTADGHAVERMFSIKRSLVKLRRLTVHQREIFLRLGRKEFSVIPDSLLPFMRDVYDHFARNVDLAESYRDLTSNVLEMHLSMQSFRMNEVMKLLTMLSTVMLPLTLVAGIYGMNFEHMPELKWKYGYPAALGLMAVTALGMVLYFRRKKWL
jgi:magnesium transporter